MSQSEDLYEPAATPDAVLCVGGGKTLYIGTLEQVGWHQHGAPVFIAGMSGAFRLRMPDGQWTRCRAAVIPPGVKHALDLGGDPLAVFYPEPNVAGVSVLARFGRAWEVRQQILVSEHPEPGPFRELYEDAGSLRWGGDALDDLLGFALRREGAAVLDPRLARIVAWLDAHPDDLTGAQSLAGAQGLSVSRFLHLFSAQVGVPFRRFRIWNRVRAAMRVALSGCNFTDSALAAGFTDSAHFTHCFRDTFGVTPSYVFGKIARAGALPAQRASIRTGP